jgi:FkbM family methyltransferase
VLTNLVYDVGMHEGEDTEFYLDRGFNVVGVEANPELVVRLHDRFAEPISSGRLQIVDKAIAESAGKVSFAINKEWSVFSSTDPVFIQRSLASGLEIDYIEVDSISFDDILQEFGIPFYLKIDIEGRDLLCVKALHRFVDRPRYISLETAATSAAANYETAFEELAQLWTLGYRLFKYVDQAALPKLTGRVLDKEGSPIVYRDRKGSGPFGEEAPGPWLSMKAAHRRMLQLIRYQNALGYGGKYSRFAPMRLASRARRMLKRLPNHSWYDLHACLGSDMVERNRREEGKCHSEQPALAEH